MANSRTIQITPNGVNGSTNVVVPQSVLIGDTNGTVNASDVSQIKSRIDQQIDGTTFRSDVVNADGYINAVDVSIAKSSVGTGLP